MKLPFSLVAFFCLTLVALADRKLEIGYLRLQSEVPNLPTGASLALLQIESAGSNGSWAVPQGGQMTGKSVSYPLAATAPTLFSDHAKWVAEYYCGSQSSPIPNTLTLLSVSATDYIVSSLLVGQQVGPSTPYWDLENHSWGYDGGDIGTELLRRLDWRIDNWGIIVVCAAGNAGPILPFPASAYNAIAVGLTKGTHSRGGTMIDGIGRQKPDLVGPEDWTSNSSPIVGSCAGLMIDKAKNDSRFGNARDPRVIKALLLAGATKEEIPNWTGTPSQPLDFLYGTGQVSIYNSYLMLLAGQQGPGTRWNTGYGWDKATTSGSGRYYFGVPADTTMKYSVALVWHRTITPSFDWRTLNSSLADLNLRLSSANETFAVEAPIAESRSTVDNVEHIYIASLPAGRYALDILGPAGVTYGLAWRGDLTSLPPVIPLAITGQPASQNVALGQPASLIAGIRGTAPFTFQWRKSGVAIAGARSPMLRFPSFSAQDQGSYDVVVTDALGTLTSATAELSLGGGNDSQLKALSARSQVNTDAAIAIAGFVIPGSKPRLVLIRGIGPNLANYGVPDSLSNPMLTLYSGASAISSNEGWKGNNDSSIRTAALSVGAAVLPEDGRDCAMLLSLPPGPYTAHLKGKLGDTGVGMIEIYDAELGVVGVVKLPGADTDDSGRMAGLATRAFVGTGSKILISGLIVSGTSPKTVLVSAIGPGLASQGLSGVLAHPKLSVYADSQPIAENTVWTTAENRDAILAAVAQVHASSLSPDRADSALLITLQPGGYTILVSGADGGTGLALAEVYEVPTAP
ncbi:MAG: S8 family serine peptidase [Opitutaceae bacterium]|jgi:hypothetical protein